MKDKKKEIDWSAPAGSSHKIRRKRKKRHVLRKLTAGLAGIVISFGFLSLLYLKRAPFPGTSPAEINTEEVNASARSRQMNASSKSISKIPVFAHRGFVDDALENSFEAYDLALTSGCPQIELDVRPSSDGVLYVSHDENLVNISDSIWEVGQHTSEELDGITMKNGEKLHRLSEVLARYRDQLIYLVEFKSEDDNPEPFLNVIRQYPQYAENVQIQSFYPGILENIHSHLPNMFVQMLVEEESKFDEALHYDWLDSIAAEQKLVNADSIARTHEAGKEIWVWTVDDMDKIHEYLSQGVNGVITDLDSAVVIYRELSGMPLA